MRERARKEREKKRGAVLEKREWKTKEVKEVEIKRASWKERIEAFDLGGEKEGEMEKEKVPCYKRQRKSVKRRET